MSSGKKKRAVENNVENIKNDVEDENDVEEEMDDDSGEEAVGENVQVDFEARNPEDSDFHGIKKLLQQLFLKANINLSELADTIISQNYVGSIIRQSYISDEEDDEDMDVDDIFGVTSVINITERKELDCVQQVKKYMIEKCQQCNQELRPQLEEILNCDDQHVGFVINERFINIPAQIALPTFESLWKEVEKAKAKRMKYDFKYLLMISKSYKIPDIAGGKPGSKKKGAKNALLFTNEEEQFFNDVATIKFTYSVKSERDTVVAGEWDDDDSEMEPLRTVMVIDSGKIDEIMGKLQENLSMA